MSWLQPEEIGTFGSGARRRASTQRARARRDQLGKNWRERARAWAKLCIFMLRRSPGCCRRSETMIPWPHRSICRRATELLIGIVLHGVSGRELQVGNELPIGFGPFRALL